MFKNSIKSMFKNHYLIYLTSEEHFQIFRPVYRTRFSLWPAAIPPRFDRFSARTKSCTPGAGSGKFNFEKLSNKNLIFRVQNSELSQNSHFQNHLIFSIEFTHLRRKICSLERIYFFCKNYS